MARRILIIQGHLDPNPDHFCHALVIMIWVDWRAALMAGIVALPGSVAAAAEIDTAFG
ncbi:MAG: hypothetical protein JO021_17100 [Alphaproteobacteria bacterium]|nr:hypothetical protein [Alphaproteobacteria bacterium]